MPKTTHQLAQKPILTRIARLTIENRVDQLLEEAGNQRHPGRALKLYQEAKALADSIFYSEAQLTCLMRSAACYGQLGEYEKAFQETFAARDKLSAFPNRRSEAALLQTVGTIHWSLGNYEQALTHLYECVALSSELNHSILLAQAYTTLGNVYFRLNDFPQSLSVFEKGILIAREAGNEFGESLLLNNLGNVFERMGDFEKAIDALQKSLEIKRRLEDRWGEGHSLVTLGDCFVSQKQYKKAIPLYKKSLVLRRSLDDKPGIITSLLALARVSRQCQDPKAALTFLTEAEPLCQEIKDLKRAAELHQIFSLTYDDLGNQKEALKHERLFNKTREAILNEEVIEKTKKLNVIHNVAQMEKEREIYRLKAEHFEKELALKKRELVTMAMNLVQKNELVDKLKEDLTRLTRSADGDVEKAIHTAIANLEKSKSDEKSWHLFEQQFESVHQSFIHNLTQRFPELTKMEIRLCVLLKIQLSTKEIANLLFISTRSVETYRLRLRKKLGIGGETNLVEFLLSFS